MSSGRRTVCNDFEDRFFTENNTPVIKNCTLTAVWRKNIPAVPIAFAAFSSGIRLFGDAGEPAIKNFFTADVA